MLISGSLHNMLVSVKRAAREVLQLVCMHVAWRRSDGH